jgi:hypothetical protein
MANEVYANGMEISCKAGNAKVIAAFPDVCLSPPPPPAGPVPVPYPNTSFSRDMQDGSRTVQISGQEIMLKDQSYFKTSPLGDEAATNGLGAGVVTHVITGKTYYVAWSMDVKIEGANVDRHLDLTTSNHASPMANDNVPVPGQDGMAKAAKCPPHAWVVTDSKTPERAKADNTAEANRLRAKGGRRDVRQAETLEFANKSIDANMQRLNIQACEVKIKCTICGQKGEIDILGDEQAAESQSESARNLDTDKRKSKQARRYNDVQNTMNDVQGTNHQPMSKIDTAQIGDHNLAKRTCARRGMIPEFV